MVYHPDSYVDVDPSVSLLHCANGDGDLPDYTPDFLPQLLGANLMGSNHVPPPTRSSFHRLPPTAPQLPH